MGLSAPSILAVNLFAPVADWVQGGVLSMLRFAMYLIKRSPEPHLTSAWFRGEYNMALQMSLWLLIPIIFAATIGALMHGGLQQVLRTYLWALPIALFGGIATISLIELCIAVDNEMTALVFQGQDQMMQSYYNELNKSAGTGWTGTFNVGWAVLQFIFMAIMMVPVMFLVFEMFFREIMIYMAAMFIPLSLAAYIWGPVRVWFYNLAELVVTMVFAKFVIASVMSFGFTALTYGITGRGEFSDQQIGLILGGIVVLFIASFSGPVLVAFVMQPGHAVLSFKSAKQVTPWNHDRKFAGQLFKANYNSMKNLVTRRGKKA